MKIENLKSPNGNKVANQFKIIAPEGEYFQSYKSVICFKDKQGQIFLDPKFLDFSATTSRYRNQFLNLTSDQIKDQIQTGQIKLKNLN